MIRKIGLTGGLASGKSRVAEMLAARLDCARIDADEICRRLLLPHAEGWQEFSRVFGTGYLTPDGQVNRPLLRENLFADKEFRRKVNGIIHPLVQKTITTQMDKITASGSRVLVEVPLLYEAGWEYLFDTVVVVYADYQICLDRLMKRDGKERNTAEMELASQMPLAEKAERADHVIDNSSTLQETRVQVDRLADLLGRTSTPRSRG